MLLPLKTLKTNEYISVALMVLLLPINNAWGLSLTDKTLPYAAPDVAFLSDKTEHKLREYQGQKVLLWMFSTWCHTCVASVRALEKQQAALKKQSLMMLAIRNYDNGGYPGPSMQKFMRKFGPFTIDSGNWVLGESSKEMYTQLNPLKYPDIYFLIDEKGLIQTVSTAPNVTLKSILEFATLRSE